MLQYCRKGGICLKYGKIVEGTFITRPNRFCATVEIDGNETVCHVKNTGRCRELLLSKSRVLLEESSNPQRKTKYDLVAVYKGDRLINMDSFAPNLAVGEWLAGGGLGFIPDLLKSESTYKNSRFDFFAQKENRKCFIEVKGVTLEKDNVVLFPDAPTLRGVKHLQELCECIKDGYEAYVIFVVQMKDVLYFTPNREMHKEFADALIVCRDNGVNVRCVDCNVTRDGMEIRDEVKIVFGDEKQ